MAGQQSATSRSLSRHERWYGRDEPPARIRRFAAGPLSFELVGVDVRAIRWGSVELLDRLYMSVRDQNWDTIGASISKLRVEQPPDGPLTITFRARNRAAAIDLEWQGTITASSSGTISYAMRGTARSAFRYCRIGFCLLHSEAAAAGRAYRAETPGGVVAGVLPRLIGPQTIVDGVELPLFPACSSLSVETAGATATATFEGSLFVMEDQRNWTDASFKTCCTGGAGYPYPAAAGQAFAQRVTITADAAQPPARPATAGRGATRIHRLELDEQPDGAWPAIGLGLPGAGSPRLTPRQLARLADLGLDHLRLDLHLAAPDWPGQLAAAVATARAAGTNLELALFADPGTLQWLDRLARLLSELPGDDGPRLARILALEEGRAGNHATSPAWLAGVKARLEPFLGPVPMAGGTDGDFAELNRERPAYPAGDGTSYSINPQVHAFDEASLAETLATQATTVRTAREFAAGPLIVSPISLRQRFNPSATEAPPRPAPGTLPASVDRRQMSLFGAGWTLGSIASLTAAGGSSLTYYEAAGWRGVMGAGNGPPAPWPFRALGSGVFPLFHVLADLAGRTVSLPVRLVSDAPAEVVGLAIRHGPAVRVLVANLGPSMAEVSVGALGGRSARIRVLDERSFPVATRSPAVFRRGSARVPLRRGQVRLSLRPFAYVRLDGAAT